MTSRIPDLDFDPAAVFAADRGDYTRRLRGLGPVARAWAGGEFWYFITGSDDVLSVLTDERCPRDPDGGFVPISFEGAEHSRYRAILQPFFSPRAVAKVLPHIRCGADEFLDTIRPAGGCDVIPVARSLAAAALLTFLGLPPRHIDALLHAETDLTDLARQALPTADGGVVGALLDADLLTDAELEGFGALQFRVGFESSTSALGFALLNLARNPTLRDVVGADPQQIRPFIEEVLRVESSAPHITRRARTDVTLPSGARIPAGSLLVLPLMSVNREEAGDTITISDTRPPRRFARCFGIDDGRVRAQRHHAFGFGPHRCLGAHFARATVNTIIEAWLDKIPNFDCEPGFEPHVTDRGFLEMRDLPLRWNT